MITRLVFVLLSALLLMACGSSQLAPSLTLDEVRIEGHGCMDGVWSWTPEDGQLGELEGSGSLAVTLSQSICAADVCVDVEEAASVEVTPEGFSPELCVEALGGVVAYCPISLP